MKWKKEGWPNYQYQEGKISFLVSADPADTKKIIRKHHKQLYKQIWQLWQNESISPKVPESLSQPRKELWNWNGSWISPISINHWMWAASKRTWPWVMCLCSEAIYEASEACPTTDASPRNWAKSSLGGGLAGNPHVSHSLILVPFRSPFSVFWCGFLSNTSGRN